MTPDSNTPYVAVRMLTYNQEKYIAQSIESVISQKTNFKYVLVIGEDCSPDRTAAICKEYAAKYPEKIQLICNPENNILTNSLNNFAACYAIGAKYIAFIEGDDYWSDPLKLQKQVDLIERSPGMTAVCHNITSLKETTGETSLRFSEKDRPADKITIHQMLVKNWASTPTVLVQSEVLKTMPDWIFNEKAVDFFMWCNAASKGYFGYIDEPMAVYRVHDQGMWSKYSMKDRIFLEVNNLVRAAQMFCADPLARKKRIEDLQLYLINNLKRNRLPEEAAAVANKLITKAILSLNFNYAKRLRQGLKEQVEINLY